MLGFLSNRWGLLLSPFIVFAATLWALESIASTTWFTALENFMPLSLLSLSVFLSIQFNRSRYSFLVLFIALGAAMVFYLPHWQGTAAFSLILIALQLNSGLFIVFKDRSLFSIHGLLRLLFLVLQGGALFYLITRHELLLEEFIQRDLLQLRIYFPWLYVPDVILIAGLLSSLFCITLLLKNNISIYAVFLLAQWALVTLACKLPVYWQLAAPAILLSMVCIMVCLSILLDSHNMAYRDELTGLPSRRALNQKLLSLGRTYTIAMLDIDHFKKFNDTHGHDVGDQVLQMVASKMAKTTGGGIAYRYGGEEFTLVFTGKQPKDAEPHLEKLRITIQDYAMFVREAARPAKKSKKKLKTKTKPKPLSVTMSMGIATRTGQHKTPEQVIKAADKALYRAKGKGRNCVSL